MNKYCLCSWSGGKDSCLALYRAIEQGYLPQKLLTMFSRYGSLLCDGSEDNCLFQGSCRCSSCLFQLPSFLARQIHPEKPVCI
jgi:hypothetical protein